METWSSGAVYNPSQSLFCNAESLFPDLQPISTPIFTQDTTQRTQKRYDEIFSDKFGNASNQGDFNIIGKHINSVETSSSPSLSKKAKRFSAPFSQKSFQCEMSKHEALNSKCELKLSREEVDKVDHFINRFKEPLLHDDKRTSSIKPAYVKKSFVAKSHVNNASDSVSSSRNFFSKTPILQEKSVLASSNNKEPSEEDIILDSDEESRGVIYGPTLQTPCRLFLPGDQTLENTACDEIQLRSVDEIPLTYRSIFSEIQYFNIVQSKVFDDAIYTDKSMVVCAPTGSGKTMIFELAIARLLIKSEDKILSDKKKLASCRPKIVYMAPIKALCSERHDAWSNKFRSVGLHCQEMTGDSNTDDFWQLQKADIILTTPEKWDSMTRRWRDNTSVVQRVQLFLIDEVHLLNDETRGATMEAVVSRMKTVQSWIGGSTQSSSESTLRFVAVSATIPNTQDIAEWLGTSNQPAVTFDLDDSYRPVALRKVVLGYPWSSNGSEFKFDISLNYKLKNVIQTYSEDKPTLIFCATRKSVEQAASILAKDISFINNASHKQALTQYANSIRNHRLRELVTKGIGYHHAGLDAHDRHLMEEIFSSGDLLVLVSTSTLAMGVNLPAHLVVIKSTCHYVRGMFQEYTQSEILQMIGRAGRPQFDSSATAVIMTRNQSRDLYHNIVNGSQKIESSLHRHLIEHLNAEVVLTTVRDVTNTLEWIRSTFLYIRVLKNPTHYGYPRDLSQEDAEKRLHELCMNNLNCLACENLVSIDDDLVLTSTGPGRVMARYYITFETIKKFSAITGTENLEELVTLLSNCNEFQEVNLRMNERTALNKLNKDKNRITIRYPMAGRIKTTPMKVSCLLQAILGCLTIQDFTLTQDVTKIFRNAVRVCLCLVELLMLKDNFKALYNAVILSKCVKAKLWEHSRYVTKQLPNIGPSLSSALANAGVCTFEKLGQTDPREIELIVNRHPPFGNHLCEAVKFLPKYTVHVEQSQRYESGSCEIIVQVLLSNAVDLQDKQTAGKKHGCYLLIGDADNCVILKQRLTDYQLISSDPHVWQRTVLIKRAQKGDELSVNLISQEWAGLDVESTYTPYYIGPRRMTATVGSVHNDAVTKANATQSKYFNKKRKPCRHNCNNKRTCAHDCCKVALDDDRRIAKEQVQVKDSPENRNSKKVKPSTPNVNYLQKFNYDPRAKYTQVESSNQVVPCTPSYVRNKGWEHLDSFRGQQMQTNDSVDHYHSLARTSYDQEEQEYQDQINLGSRMTYNEINNEQQNKSKLAEPEQLWTEDLENINLPRITPRSCKSGFTFKQMNKNGKAEEASKQIVGGFSSTPKRMGKVFAWKTSVGQRSLPLKPSPPSGYNQQHCVEQNPTFVRPNNAGYTSSTIYKPSQKRCASGVCLSDRSSLNRPQDNLSVANMNVKPSSTNIQQLQTNQHQQAAGYLTRKQDFSGQLWDQSPLCGYPTDSFQSKKKASFRDYKQEFHPQPSKNESISIQDESDISIHCDFDLEDTEEDLMLLEACMEAEDFDEVQKLSQTLMSNLTDHQLNPWNVGLSNNFARAPNCKSLDSNMVSQQQATPVVAGNQFPSQSLSSQRRLTSFFDRHASCQTSVNSKEDESALTTNGNNNNNWDDLSLTMMPVRVKSVKKESEIIEARKMFDSVFEGIF